MLLRTNILATFASQGFVTVLGIVALPLYLQYMGREAFGLVGFFAILQASFQLFDLGLTAAAVRQTACYRGGIIDASAFAGVLRALEKVFLCIGLIAIVVVASSADFIAKRWLSVQELPIEQVRLALYLMGAIIGLRWMGGLYRGVVIGFERLVSLAAVSSVIAVARFVLVIPVLVWIGATPSEFFVFQLGVAVVEFVALAAMAYRVVPRVARRGNCRLTALKPLLPFALSIGVTSSIWVVVTQMDKLLLSKLLPLGDYALFTVGVVVAGAVLAVSAPIGAAIMPHLARLHAEGLEKDLTLKYRQLSEVIAIVVMPAAAVLALTAHELLFAWTGDAEVATRVSPILQLYAIGNGVLAVASFPYYLQFARGDMRLHIVGSALFVSLLMPGVYVAAGRYGGVGAGLVWLVVNSAYFLFWTPLVHRRHAPGLHTAWLLRSLAPIAATTAVGCAAAMALPWVPANRWESVMHIATCGMLVLGAAAIGSSQARQMVVRWAAGRVAQG